MGHSDGDLTGVRGAIYVPARAYNAYQIWRDYDPEVVERDLSYAERLGLNAVRVFCSYERWDEDREGHGEAFDHLLDAAAGRGIRVLPILFESAGVEPTRANLTDRDPATACAVRSPSHAVIKTGNGGGLLARLGGGGDRWERPREFVGWFVSRYGDDERLLGIEIMNEPGGWKPRERFAADMLRTAAERDPAAALTMGCKSIGNNRRYDDLDVLQFHHNVPPTAADMREAIAEAVGVARDAGKPVWLTEWQRTREQPPDKMDPNYASLARTIRESDLDGDFFWSLMLKPAWLPKMRKKGRLNGVFHEDGAVWSADDVAAFVGGPDDGTGGAAALEPPVERREPPAWARRGGN